MNTTNNALQSAAKSLAVGSIHVDQVKSVEDDIASIIASANCAKEMMVRHQLATIANSYMDILLAILHLDDVPMMEQLMEEVDIMSIKVAEHVGHDTDKETTEFEKYTSNNPGYKALSTAAENIMNAVTTPAAPVQQYQVGEIGSIVTVQLGNPSDSYWTPIADAVLLVPIGTKGSDFFGVAKDNHGDLILLRDMSNKCPRDCFAEGSEAEYYCTATANISTGRYHDLVSQETVILINEMIHKHSAQLAMLKPYSRVSKTN